MSFNVQNYFKRGNTVVLTLKQRDPNGETGRQWCDQDALMLVRLMGQSIPNFRNQRCRKKDVWVEISEKLNEEGFFWTAEDCRKKWSNMIRTFKSIEEQRRDPSTSKKRVKWPFYEGMYAVLKTEGSESIPEAMFIAEVLKEGNTAASSQTFSKHDMNETTEHISETVVVTTSDKNETSMNVVSVDILPDATTTSVMQEMSAADLEQIMGVNDPDVMEVEHFITSKTSKPSEKPSELKQQLQTHPKSPIATTTSKQQQHQNRQLNLSQGQKVSLLQSGKTSPATSTLDSKSRKRKLNRNSPHKGESDDLTTGGVSDTILERFLDVTSKQHKKMMEKLTEFHENTLACMRERNLLLQNLCDVLQNIPDSSGGPVVTSSSLTAPTETIVLQNAATALNKDNVSHLSPSSSPASFYSIPGVPGRWFRVPPTFSTDGKTLRLRGLNVIASDSETVGLEIDDNGSEQVDTGITESEIIIPDVVSPSQHESSFSNCSTDSENDTERKTIVFHDTSYK